MEGSDLSIKVSLVRSASKVTLSGFLLFEKKTRWKLKQAKKKEKEKKDEVFFSQFERGGVVSGSDISPRRPSSTSCP